MPVINPIWFYLMSVCDGMKIIATICALFAATLLLFCIADMVGFGGNNFAKRLFKPSVIVLCIALSVLVFCPSSKTMEKMTVAKNVTYERVEQATDVVSTVYGDNMNLFEKDKE